MYTFREIRQAICSPAAGKEESGFPYGVDWRRTLERIKAEDVYADILKEVVEEAERAKRETLRPLPFSAFHCFEKQGTRLEYENPYFDRRRRLAGLVFATLIEKTDRYLPTLENLIWDICGEYTWCVPAHLPFGLEALQRNPREAKGIIDLFAAETAHGLAEALYLLGDKLNPWIAYRIKTEIRERTLEPLYRESSRFWWEGSTNNWSAVCAGAVGMAALLVEDDKERLAGLIGRLLQALECYMEGFHNDGGCPEGIGYWLYGFGYYTYFAEMLEAYTTGALRLLDSEKSRSITQFPQAIALSNGCCVSYSDASARAKLHTGMVSKLVERYELPAPYMEGVPSFHQDHCYRFAHISRNLLWSDPKRLGHSIPAGVWELEDLQWYVSRHLAGDEMIAFSAKGGHNGEPHNHNDVANFILHAAGENLLTDLGAGVYTKDYFGEKRYTFLHNSSKGHSVPLIDGQEQQEGTGAGAVVTGKKLKPEELFLELDATAAYPVPHLKRFLRRFEWSFAGGTGRLRLSDCFQFAAAPQRLEEVFISHIEPVLEPGAIEWRGGRGAARLQYDAAGFVPSVEAIVTEDHRANAITVYRVVLEARRLGEEMEFTGEFQVSLV